MAANESLAKVLDKEWEDKSLAEIVKASPAVLQGLTDERAAKIAEALGAKTIGELANNKYVRWAQALATLAEYEA
jgi:pheromone shutdown protein TraB